MRNFLLLIFAGLSLFACEGSNTTPEGVLPKEQMISFLIDLHIAEARINDLSLRRDSAEKLFKKVEDSLYIKNGIKHDTIYKNSYEYYLKDISGLDEIYSAVVDSLSLRERLSKEKEKETETETVDKKDSTIVKVEGEIETKVEVEEKK